VLRRIAAVPGVEAEDRHEAGQRRPHRVAEERAVIELVPSGSQLMDPQSYFAADNDANADDHEIEETLRAGLDVVGALLVDDQEGDEHEAPEAKAVQRDAE